MKRSRGRGRRPQSNHNRPFDSTGPDVKIRGTAAHIYEKYLQLARDAGSLGDRVQQETYLQHAEHYFRVLMAAQQQGGPQMGQQGNYPHPPNPNPNPNPQQGVSDAGEMRGPQGGQPYSQPTSGSGPSFTLTDQGEETEEVETDDAVVR